MSEPSAEALSAAGRARRDAMLTDLTRVLVRRRRFRSSLRLVALAALPAVLLFWSWWPRGTGDRSPRDDFPAARAQSLALEVVHDDPAVLERCAATDDELLAFLAEAKRPAGLLRLDGQVFVVEDEPAR